MTLYFKKPCAFFPISIKACFGFLSYFREDIGSIKIFDQTDYYVILCCSIYLYILLLRDDYVVRKHKNPEHQYYRI